MTPLMLASGLGFLNIAKLLLEGLGMGFDINAKNAVRLCDCDTIL